MRGTLRVPAPSLLLRTDRHDTQPAEVPLADLQWKVRLPSGYEATWTGGTLTTDLPRPEPAAVTMAREAGLFASGGNLFSAREMAKTTAFAPGAKTTVEPAAPESAVVG